MKKKVLPILLLTLTMVSCGIKVGGNSSVSSVTTSNVTSSVSEALSSSEATSEKESSFSSNSVGTSNNVVSSSNSVASSSEAEHKDAPSFPQDVDAFTNVLTFSDLFDLANKVEVTIDISEEELAKLQADYETELKTEIYRHCNSVTISITKNGTKLTSTYYDVGIRQKGNTSRDDILTNNKLNLNHFKLSFDETFDEVEMYGSDAYDWTKDPTGYKARGDRAILGTSGLDIKWNKNFDSTHIKEIYASKIYEANGILAQHVGLTTMALKRGDNVTSFGLCTLFEPASKSLIKRSLQSGTSYLNFGTWKQEKAGTYGISGVNYGDLYKASYGKGEGASSHGADLSSSSISNKRVGIGNISGSYIPAYERKTNTDVTYDDAQLKALVSAIESGSYDNISAKMDLDYLAKVEACNYIIGNPDDMRNNNNNYMIYIRRTDGKAVIIPIDNDRCFGITKDYNPDGKGMTEMAVMTRQKAGGGEVNKLLLNTTLSESSNLAKTNYQEYVKTLSESDWVKEETFNAIFNQAKDTYGDASCASPIDSSLPGFTLEDNENKTFSEYITKKLARVDEFLGKEPSAPTDGNCGDIYLNGSFAGWNAGTSYKFEYKGNGDYTITFTPNNVDNGQIKCKIYDGGDYSRIDWAINEEGKLTFNGKNYSSFIISSVTTSSSITISLNTLTKVITIDVK